MNTSTTAFCVLFCLIFVIPLNNGNTISSAESVGHDVYIVYLGECQHDHPELIEKSHHDILMEVVGSKEKAKELMITHYKHGFSGFAAKLTPPQVQKIRGHPDVVHVFPNLIHQVKTTRSWDYLGLSRPMPNNLLGHANLGDDVIIGIIDSGLSPASESFKDEGLGPVPSRWKGACVKFSGCNKKIIGAKYFINGFKARMQANYPDVNMTTIEEMNELSPLDMDGHGTHVAGTAAGSYVPNQSYSGLAQGTLRGGAPKARLAIYKVGPWNQFDGQPGGLDSVDILNAVDEAIHDGVDVISASLGPSTSGYGQPDVDEKQYNSLYAIAAFHAVSKGVTIVYSGGNDGPLPSTVIHHTPFSITVAATSMDREFPVPITLGNNVTLTGRTIYIGNDTGFLGLFLSEEPSCDFLNQTLQTNTSDIAGKVALCFVSHDESRLPEGKIAKKLKELGGKGIIVAKHANYHSDITTPFPYVEVDFDTGSQIQFYALGTSSPVIRISPSKTVIGKSVPPKVAAFSSRGPNTVVPEILKPDIAAPGVNILAASHLNGWKFLSGTSMATPHVSGIVALLKHAHRDWSPAAIKSAIMTTAWNTNRYGLPIYSEGSARKVADPFDIGAGIVNPNGANSPGLVYDMGPQDFLDYLCGMGYSNGSISKVMTKYPVTCPAVRPSLLDLNLPSITIPSLRNTTTIKRTVTNVGPTNSVYKVEIKNPTGIVVSVDPKVLVFNSKVKTISFKLTISATEQGINTKAYSFGSLTWTDGVHVVRSPISVRTEEAPLF